MNKIREFFCKKIVLIRSEEQETFSKMLVKEIDNTKRVTNTRKTGLFPVFMTLLFDESFFSISFFLT